MRLLNKPNRILKETTNNREYKIAKANLELYNICPICPPYGGCNSHRIKIRDYRCWKRYRKTQYKLMSPNGRASE